MNFLLIISDILTYLFTVFARPRTHFFISGVLFKKFHTDIIQKTKRNNQQDAFRNRLKSQHLDNLMFPTLNKNKKIDYTKTAIRLAKKYNFYLIIMQFKWVKFPRNLRGVLFFKIFQNCLGGQRTPRRGVLREPCFCTGLTL